jgi:hypothetical protein
LFAEAGLAVIGSAPTKNVLPLRHVVRTASSLLGISGPWTDRLPETKLRLRLGNIMMVARV